MSKRAGGSRVDGCSSSADPAQACRSRDRDGFPDGVLRRLALRRVQIPGVWRTTDPDDSSAVGAARSEEHTSELQSRLHLVCRLLLEKKKKKCKYRHYREYGTSAVVTS